MVTRRAFLRKLDASAVERAIARAEERSSGEIRVSIAGFFIGDGRRLAARAFRRLGIQTTRHRNGVLLMIAPARRQLVVLGDEGIHGFVSDAFWTEVAEQLGAELRAGRFTKGVIEAVARIGDALARHFPADAAGNPNELPDAIDAGDRRGPPHPRG